MIVSRSCNLQHAHILMQLELMFWCMCVTLSTLLRCSFCMQTAGTMHCIVSVTCADASLSAAQASTPVSLKATAGLRLLPGGKADAILTAVEAHLKTYPFQLKEGAVSIMDGTRAPTPACMHDAHVHNDIHATTVPMRRALMALPACSLPILPLHS